MPRVTLQLQVEIRGRSRAAAITRLDAVLQDAIRYWLLRRANNWPDFVQRYNSEIAYVERLRETIQPAPSKPRAKSQRRKGASQPKETL